MWNKIQRIYVGTNQVRPTIVYNFKTQNVLTFSYRDTNMQYWYTAWSWYYLNKNNNYGWVAVWSLPDEAYVNWIRKLTLYGSSSSNLSAPCMTLAQAFNNSSEWLRPRAWTSYHGIYYRHNSTSYWWDTTEVFPTTDKVLVVDFVNNKVSYAWTTIDLEIWTNTTWQTLWANKSFKIGCGSWTYSSGTWYTYLTWCKIEY